MNLFFKNFTKSIRVILIIALGFLCLNNYKVFEAVKAEAVFGYQRLINVVNSTGGTLTNYQIRIAVNTSSLILTGKMRSDCGDIRIRDTNQTTDLNYFLESGCNTTNTIIWAKIPSLATGTRVLYLFYGDSAIISASNPSGTMDRYDDMQTTPSCTLFNNAVYDSVNKWISLTTNNQNQSGQCEYNYTPGNGFYTKYEFYNGTSGGADANWLYAYQRSTPTSEDVVDRGYHFTYDEYQDRICFTNSTTDNGPGIVCNNSVTNIDNSTWHTAEIWFSGQLAIISMDGTQYVNGSDTGTVLKTRTRFGIAARTGGISNDHRVRKIIVAKYDTNVVVTLNSEQNAFNTLSFSIRNSTDTADTNLCDLGTLTISSTATCQYRLKVSTTASNGYTIYMKASGHLTNGTSSITNALSGPTGSNISGSTLNTEKYGVVITPGTATSGTVSATSLFSAATNAVLYNYTSNTNILTSTGANLPSSTDTARTALVTHQLNIANSTPPGSYNQSITYGVVPSF